MSPAPIPPATPTVPVVKTWAVTARLLRRFRPVRARALGVLMLYVARTAVGIATPLLLARAIGVLIEHEGKGGPLPDAFVTYAILNGIAVLLRCVSFLAVTTASAALSQDVENALRRELFAKVMTLRFRWHDANRSGKTIARSLRDMEKAKQFFREVVFGYAEIVLLVVGVTVLAFATWWTFGVAAVLVFGSTCVGVAFAGRGSHSWTARSPTTTTASRPRCRRTSRGRGWSGRSGARPTRCTASAPASPRTPPAGRAFRASGPPCCPW